MLNKNVLNSISWAKKENKLAHLYLFVGKSKNTIDLDILAFLKEINDFEINWEQPLEQIKNYDCIVLDGDQGELGKAEIEQAFYDMSLQTNYEDTNDKRIIVLKNIEKASVQALNSILKTIEEPFDNLLIILSTTKEKNVLSTILSRAQKIVSLTMSAQEIYGQLVSQGTLEPFCLVASYLADDFREAQNYSKDSFIALFDQLLAALIETIKRNNKHYLYSFLLNELTKENKQKNIFLLDSMKLITFGNVLFNDLKIKNKYLEQIKQISKELVLKFPKSIEFPLAIDAFFKFINENANFIIQKELLLLNLLEKYE
ncbi:hypothetical protein [Mycoplasmopsis glycophila]|uniref:DNA polymerase III subunit delta n=1 Tax=Mycoplasmopsis glycophila TaxID=171285 RepID=A0A449AU21_9BACT|nr:hypothetical protein [Mycoplasmopsis glycophila]VEU70019.1 DNA polymerase III subunit delta' [Mycoplasmopsis glycophila]